MDMTLGGFGDRRLEKGGSFFWPACWRLGLGRCGFAGLEATGRVRSV